MRFPTPFETGTPLVVEGDRVPGADLVVDANQDLDPDRPVAEVCAAVVGADEVGRDDGIGRGRPSIWMPGANSPLFHHDVPQVEVQDEEVVRPGHLGGRRVVSEPISVPGVFNTWMPTVPPVGCPKTLPESRLPVPAPSSRIPENL